MMLLKFIFLLGAADHHHGGFAFPGTVAEHNGLVLTACTTHNVDLAEAEFGDLQFVQHVILRYEADPQVRRMAAPGHVDAGKLA